MNAFEIDSGISSVIHVAAYFEENETRLRERAADSRLEPAIQFVRVRLISWNEGCQIV
jgi:hypothetical protein